jgi:hypothetical protein
VEAHIDGLRSLATIAILNERSLEDLHEQLDTWLAKCGAGIRT